MVGRIAPSPWGPSIPLPLPHLLPCPHALFRTLKAPSHLPRTSALAPTRLGPLHAIVAPQLITHLPILYLPCFSSHFICAPMLPTWPSFRSIWVVVSLLFTLIVGNNGTQV
ncbi:hypothetical protein M758_3G006200 [Ceratodon purpureus]|nr:hypothetical protein M758_3G006200 [Ceratodon purpureus]